MTNINIFENVPENLSEELLEVLAKGENVRIERIISQGNVTPPDEWYDQDEKEFVILLKGSAEILFEGDVTLGLKEGDWINIPAHKKHRVTKTSKDPKCVWLAVFYK